MRKLLYWIEVVFGHCLTKTIIAVCTLDRKERAIGIQQLFEIDGY
jgi:hypothetical protein